MSYRLYSTLYRLLKHKYNVPAEADYQEAIDLMKKAGVTEEELDVLHEAWVNQDV